MARDLRVRIVGDTSSLNRALGKAQVSGGKFNRVFGTAMRGAAIAAGAAFTGLAVAAKVGFDEFNEGQKVAAQTNAVIKSTGGVANVTAKQVDRLAVSLMKKSGVDDEAIKSGQNMLLTFKNVRNETGRGNDIFDQATGAILDLSVAMGKDMQSSAIMVGKALNDPIRGLTAMRRVGIQFTKAQEDQIKALVEAGDVMGAQKVILKELESQFGGSAKAAGKTFAGQMNILKETFANAAGEVVGRLMPAVIRFAQFALPLVVKGLDLVIQGATWLGDKFTEVSNKFSGEGAAKFERVGGILRSIGNWIRTNLVPIIQELGRIWQAAVTRVAQVVEEHREELERIWRRVGAAIQAFAKVALPVIRFVFVQVLPRAVGFTITALDKITGALAGVASTFIRIWGAMRNAAVAAIGFIRARWQQLLAAFGPLGATVARSIGFFNKLRTVGTAVFGALARAAEGVASAVARIVGWVSSAISAIGRLSSAIRSIPRPSLPSFPDIPGFASGGVVPGPVGAPRLILAHGGETVLPTHRPGFRGGVRDVHFHGPVYGSPAEIARMVKRELAYGDRRDGS